MVRHKSDKPNLITITVRLEEKYLSDLKLYAQVVGKTQSEILRSLVIATLDAIPEHTRQLMSVLAFSRQPDFHTDIALDIRPKHDSLISDNSDG